MVGTVARAAVAMHPTVVARQQPSQGLDHVGLRARDHLHEGYAGGGVGSEHVAQAVPQPLAERCDLVGDVGQGSATGADLKLDGIHFASVAWARLSGAWLRLLHPPKHWISS